MGVAGTVIAGVGRGRQPADQRDFTHTLQRQQIACIFQEHNRFLRRFAGQGAVGGAADLVGRVIARLHQAQLGAQNAQHGVIHPRQGNFALLDQIFQMLVEVHLEGHLHILPGQGGFFGVAHAIHEVGHHEAFETPFLFKMPVNSSRFCPHHSPFTLL